MTYQPPQLYLLGWALLLYSLPVSSILSDENQRYVLPIYVAAQYLFICLCNKIIHGKWVICIILIEAVCMTWNTILFALWDAASSTLWSLHSSFMFLALVLEILIINLSLGGGVNERIARRNTHRPNNTFSCRLNHRQRLQSGPEVVECKK